ncbi:hypothetical protein AB0C96_05705 [Streptomyces sp. NPDC048506]|uniref:hypothetical protein n=1 Tax=Streptomyces sp. NPDC048506 TaxID=3155028 RepID=UPI0034405377
MNEKPSQRTPRTVTWEIEVVDGEEGEVLRRRQAEVMHEVVAWIVEQRRRQGEATGPETP